MPRSPHRGPKPRLEDEPEVEPVAARPAPTLLGTTTTTTPTARVTEIERETFSLLPASFVWSITGLDDPDVKRSAKLIARELDVPPQYMWGRRKLHEYFDPIFGGPLRLSTLRRLSNDVEPAIVGAMIQSAAQGAGARKTGISDVDPAAISKLLRAIGPVVDTDAVTAIALAADAARRNVDPRIFGANLELLHNWDNRTPTDNLPVTQLVSLATYSAERKMRLQTAEDVVRLLSPVVARRAGQQEKREVSQQSVREIVATAPTAVRGFALPDIEFGEEAQAVADAVERGEKSALELAKEIEQQIILDKTAFSRSWIGKALSWVGEKWDAAWRGVQKAAVTVSTPFVAVGGGLVAAAVPGGRDFDQWATDTQRAHESIIANLSAGQDLGDQAAERFGLDPWMGTAIDFLVQWRADPAILAGRSITALRGLRTAPGLLKPRGIIARQTGRFPFVQRARGARLLQEAEDFQRSALLFSRSRGSRKLAEAALRSDGDLLTAIDRYALHFATGSALDKPYMLRLAAEFRTRFPTLDSEALREWQQGILAHFGVPPAPGSIAARALALRRAEASEGIRRLATEVQTFKGRTFNADDSGLLVPANADDLVRSVLDDIGTKPLQALRLEVPHTLKPIPGFGGVRLGARALGRSRLGQTGAGRAVAALGNINPGNVFRIHADPSDVGRYVLLRGRRWRALKETEIREFQAEMTKIVGSGVGLERRMIDLVTKMDEVATRRIAQQAIRRIIGEDIPQDVLDEFTEVALGELRGVVQQANKQSFGVLDDIEKGFASRTRETLSRPVLETQLVNEIALLDPVQVRKVLNRYAGTIKGLDRSWVRTLKAQGIEAPPLSSIYRKTDELNALGRAALRTWKFMVVPRPGYIGRVILGDENLRFVATTGSFFERLGATNMEEAVKSIARAGAAGGIVTAPAIKPIGAVGGVIGKGLDKVLDALYPDEIIRFSDDVVARFPRPVKQAYQPLANPLWRENELLDDMMKGALRNERLFRVKGSWEPLTPDKPLYYRSWAHALNNQLGQSGPGRRALQSVAMGDSITQTREVLIRYARSEGFATVRTRIGVPEEELVDWADEVARLTHGYTLGNRELAVGALARSDDLEQLLRNFGDDIVRPTIHGPSAEYLLYNRRNPASRFVEWWYDTMVRQPETWLNRQPYYTLWKTRAERSYRALGATDDVAIEAASRDFALGQVKRIMFDFTENTRLGEMLAGGFPFVQPFFEAYQVWGHILIHRNPAFAGYVKATWELGKDTGFLRKDENDQWVVPMSWYMGAAPTLAMMFHAPGWQLSTPLSSLNLFFSSTFRVPSSGIAGMVAGGAPIPVPGLSPWASIVLQNLFKETRNQSVGSWLFQFGPNTPVVPVFMERALRAINPEWFGDDRLTSSAQDFLRLYQFLGTDKDEDGKPVPFAELQKRATGDAQKMNVWRAFFGMFQLGATMVDFPTEAKEQEWRDTLEKYEGDFNKARDAFLDTPGNEDLTLITVGKTFFGRGITDPRTGKLIETGARVPASQYAKQILEHPAFSEFAQRYPAWAAMLITAADPKVANEFDFSVFAEQVSEKVIRYKSLEEFVAEGESVPFWEAVRSYYDLRNHRQDILENQGLGDDNEAIEALNRQEQEFLGTLFYRFPLVANQYLRPETGPDGTTVIGANWQVPTGAGGAPYPIVLQQARQIAAIDKFAQFPAIAGLREYLGQRDDIAAEMAKLGISSIESTTAERVGLTKRFEQMKKDVIERFPAFSPFLGMLADDLLDVPNKYEQRIATMQQKHPERYERFVQIDTQLEELSDQPFDELTGDDRNAAFQDYREYVDSAVSKDAWAVKLWWNKKGYYDQQQYLQNLRVRPPIFYSRFDWDLAGVKLTKQASTWLLQIMQARMEIDSRRNAARAAGEDIDTGALYDDIDKWVRERVSQDKSFAQAIQGINAWGWGAESAGLTEEKGRAGWAWENLIATVRGLQQQITDRGLNGVNFGSAEDKALYYNAKQAVLERVKEYMDWSTEFDTQWREMQDASGDPLIDWLIPDDYFPLGVSE